MDFNLNEEMKVLEVLEVVTSVHQEENTEEEKVTEDLNSCSIQREEPMLGVEVSSDDLNSCENLNFLKTNNSSELRYNDKPLEDLNKSENINIMNTNTNDNSSESLINDAFNDACNEGAHTLVGCHPTTTSESHDKQFENLSKSENKIVNNNSSESQYNIIDYKKLESDFANLLENAKKDNDSKSQEERMKKCRAVLRRLLESGPVAAGKKTINESYDLVKSLVEQDEISSEISDSFIEWKSLQQHLRELSLESSKWYACCKFAAMLKEPVGLDMWFTVLEPTGKSPIDLCFGAVDCRLMVANPKVFTIIPRYLDNVKNHYRCPDKVTLIPPPANWEDILDGKVNFYHQKNPNSKPSTKPADTMFKKPTGRSSDRSFLSAKRANDTITTHPTGRPSREFSGGEATLRQATRAANHPGKTWSTTKTNITSEPEKKKQRNETVGDFRKDTNPNIGTATGKSFKRIDKPTNTIPSRPSPNGNSLRLELTKRVADVKNQIASSRTSHLDTMFDIQADIEKVEFQLATLRKQQSMVESNFKRNQTLLDVKLQAANRQLNQHDLKAKKSIKWQENADRAADTIRREIEERAKLIKSSKKTSSTSAIRNGSQIENMRKQRSLALNRVDEKLEKIPRPPSENRDGFNLTLYESSGWDVVHLKGRMVPHDQPLFMGDHETWSAEHSNFQANSLSADLIRDTQDRLEGIVWDELDCVISSPPEYVSAIQRLALKVERLGLETAYRIRDETCAFSCIRWVNDFSKVTPTGDLKNEVQFHAKSRAGEFYRAADKHATVMLEILNKMSPEDMQDLIGGSLKGLLNRLWWFFHMDREVSKNTDFNDPC